MSQLRGGGSESSQRFPKSRRLRKRREFLAVQQRGKKIHLRDVVVLCAARRGCSRLGITASRKVGKATVRNRFKRLVREVWRRHRGLLPEGLDMVFIAKRGAPGMTYASLLGQLQELARRLRHGPAET